MWFINDRGEKEFRGENNNWYAAAAEAKECGYFMEDVEDEQVADEKRSCYNCRYRRWSARSFVCLKINS